MTAAKVSPWRPNLADKTMSTEAGGLLKRGEGKWATWTCRRCKAVSPPPGPAVALMEPFLVWRDRHAGAACEPEAGAKPGKAAR